MGGAIFCQRMTTSLKRACLEDAWDNVKTAPTPDLRTELRNNEKAARKLLAGGSLSLVEANGRRTQFAEYGAGQVTTEEMVEGWRELIDQYDRSKNFLVFCALYGLDPDATELQDDPIDLPAPVGSPTPQTDAIIFAWMMDHLIPITEARSDYSSLRVANTGGFV